MHEEKIGETSPQPAALTVGVVADTHVPDRVQELHPGLISGLRAAQVTTILHAGDVCVPRVLRQLEEIAPVYAVRGNRDFALAGVLPWARRLEFAGVPLALVHGMGNWQQYVFDKFEYAAKGYNLRRYQGFMSRAVAGAKVIVFGHTHHSEDVWHEGRLWFNPGSATRGDRLFSLPSYGLLHFYPEGKVVGEIIELSGARLKNRRWSISK